MKKAALVLGVCTSLFAMSCQKQDSQSASNEWTMSGKTFPISNIIVNGAGNSISGTDGNGSVIDFTFAAMPSKTDNYTITDEPYENHNIAVRCILNGNFVYKSINNGDGSAYLHVSGGSYRIILNKAQLVNTAYPFDTVVTNAYLSQF
jgi:hypothetical protein